MQRPKAFEEKYVKIAGSLLPLATNLIMTRTSDESLLHIAIYNNEQDADASLAPIQKFMSDHQKLFKDTMMHTTVSLNHVKLVEANMLYAHYSSIS